MNTSKVTPFNPLSSEQSDIAAYRHAIHMIQQLEVTLHATVTNTLNGNNIPLNSVQALLLYQLGDNEMRAGELMARGLFFGTNVSYSLKKLTELGYVSVSKGTCRSDRRIVWVAITEKGRTVEARIAKLIKTLATESAIPTAELDHFCRIAAILEKTWKGS
jgi:DNA-binding MarR family transcriptional regulator